MKTAVSKFVIIFATVLTLAPNSFVGALSNLSPKYPVIQITKWLESDDYEWKNYGEADAGLVYNSSLFVIPGDVAGIILECNASYPIEIMFEMDQVFDNENFMMMYSVFTKARREAKSISDKSSYQYSMKYEIYNSNNQNTGFYTCQGTQNPERQTRVYMMWEGNSPPYLIGAGNTITVSTYKKDAIVLPCRVSITDVDVTLEKEMNITKDNNETTMEFITLGVNESVTYDPSHGFHLILSQFPTIEGYYRCSTYELDDVLYINVTSEPPAVIGNPTWPTTVDASAALNFEPSDSSFVCCSNSASAPKLIYFNCATPTICKMMRNLIVRNANVLSSLMSHGSNTKNCTKQSIGYYGNSGLAVCKGDGIDISLEVFFPVEKLANGSRLPEIYFKLSDAKQENLLRVYPLLLTERSYKLRGKPYRYSEEKLWPSNGQMYSGQNISFRCETSDYYFASGIKWQILWKNSTTEILDSTDVYDMGSYMYFWRQSKPISIIVQTEMVAITCYAPVWSSTEWVQKVYNLNISEPTPPTIHTSTPDYVYWILNETDKSIDCKSKGDPTPLISWSKHGKKLTTDKVLKLTKPETGTLTLEFKLASYDVHGDYTCTSSNIAGTVQKTFTVILKEPHPWTATIVIIVVSLLLILAIGLLVWRIKIQRNVADGIRRTEFQHSQEQD